MADSNPKTSSRSDLYKDFFDDATLSDLAIHLGNAQTVRVHRGILCRRSEYFTKLLTGPFQESGAKEIELKEDNADALFALLLYLYELPWDNVDIDYQGPLCTDANIYLVADKYQVHGLKVAVSEQMKGSFHIDDLQDEVKDFLDALELIMTGTPANDVLARKVMVEACVRELRYLHQAPRFQSLLMECAELGAAIISHQSLRFSLAGAWMRNEDVTHNASIDCRSCDAHFQEEFAWQNRYEEEWTCSKCGHKSTPRCFHCGSAVEWVDRELLPERV